MKKIKILLIANYKLGVGGISGQVELLHKYLNREEGYAVDIYSLKGNPIKRIILIFRLLFVSKKYDVLHIHACCEWGFLPAIVGVVVSKLWHKQSVLTYHGGGAKAFFAQHTRLVKWTFSKIDTIIVLSGFLKQIFDEYNIPAIIIPNIVEMNDCLFKQRDRIRPNFISVRHLRELYNVSCILRAFKIVQQQLPEATLTILGDGNQRVDLEKWTVENNLKNVTFVGAVPHKEMYHYLQQADVFVSAPKVDNMPMSVLEAFNAGLLVISSNVGGVPFLVADNSTGYLFESDNDKQFAEKMLLAVRKQKKSLEIIKKAKQESEKYRWSNIRNSVLKIYNSL